MVVSGTQILRTNRAQKPRWFSIRTVQSKQMIIHCLLLSPDA